MEPTVISTRIRYSSLPESYVRPVSDRPNLSKVSDCENVPIIDLGSEDRSLIIQQIRDACQQYGFFQVINHGVAREVVEKMQEVASEFFRLPVEEKMKLYSDDPSKTMRLSTSFNVKKETVHNWRDYLRLHCHPLEQYSPEWPSNPSSFKEIVSNYCKEVRELGFRLEEAISESLGLEKDCIKEVLGEQGQHMAINYYPECPEPDLTYGLPSHADLNALTILLQDLQVSGLQVFKEDEWLAVKPHPNAFFIKIGDQLQELSNGKYKSVWHRAIVNSFICHNDCAIINALDTLAEEGTSSSAFAVAQEALNKTNLAVAKDKKRMLAQEGQMLANAKKMQFEMNTLTDRMQVTTKNLIKLQSLLDVKSEKLSAAYQSIEATKKQNIELEAENQRLRDSMPATTRKMAICGEFLVEE